MSDALSDADLRSLDVQCAEVMGYETKWCHVWISGDFMWAYPEPTNRTTYEPMYEVWRGHGSIFNEEKWEGMAVASYHAASARTGVFNGDARQC
jgi:hypothetical protein